MWVLNYGWASESELKVWLGPAVARRAINGGKGIHPKWLDTHTLKTPEGRPCRTYSPDEKETGEHRVEMNQVLLLSDSEVDTVLKKLGPEWRERRFHARAGFGVPMEFSELIIPDATIPPSPRRPVIYADD